MPSPPTSTIPSTLSAGWLSLLEHLDANRLVPASTATVPMAVHEDILPELQLAHAAGMSTALGTRMSYSASDPVTAAVLATYFNQGLQYGLQQRVAALQLQPVQPTPPAPTLQSQPKIVKIRDPDLFDGTNRAKLETFKSQVRNKVRGNSSEFPDAASQVSYAVSYLSGSAYDWAAPQVDRQGEGAWVWENLAAFFTALDTAFNDPDQARTAAWQIDHLKQGKRACPLYYADFTTLVTKLPDWRDSTKKVKFYEGLSEELKDALVGRLDDDDITFEQYACKCITLDRQLEQRRLERAGKRTTAPPSAASNAPSTLAKPAASTATGTHPGPMDLSAVSRKKLTDEQKQYRRANNLCMYCGKGGHFVSACPSRTTQNLRLAEATLSPPPTSYVVVEETKK